MADQQDAAESSARKLLQRSVIDRRIAGVCGGLARYLDTDPAFIRVLWLILTVAGIIGLGIGIFLGILAYIICWLIIPEAPEGSEPIVQGQKRLERSATDVTLAGVCGGIAEYFSVDVTVVRVLWVLLTFCTLVIGGFLAYVAAWFIMPVASATPMAAAAPPAADPSPPPTEATDSPTDAAAPAADSTASTTGTGAEESQS